MKGKILKIILFAAVVLVTKMIVFSSSAINLKGTTWETKWGTITFYDQTGSDVKGTYTRAGGELIGTLEGQLLKGWWRETDNEKECGPENAWSGPFVFDFAEDLKSFKGDWGHCDKQIDDLNPNDETWNGSIVSSCPPGYTECRDECCDEDEICCGGGCCDEDEICCGGGCCHPSKCCGLECCDEPCCGDECCAVYAICCGDKCCEAGQECCGSMCCDPGKCCGGDKCCPPGKECCEDDLCCDIGRCCLYDKWCCEEYETCTKKYGCIYEYDPRVVCMLLSLYGEDSEEAELLRDFRDNVLSKTSIGQKIIKLYNKWSPTIVEVMEENETFKVMVREIIDGFLPVIKELVE